MAGAAEQNWGLLVTGPRLKVLAGSARRSPWKRRAFSRTARSITLIAYNKMCVEILLEILHVLST